MSATPQPAPARVREFIISELAPPDASAADIDRAAVFLVAWAALPPQQQFLLQQRLIFGRLLEDIALDYKTMFGKPLTAAGASAAFKSALLVLRSPP